MGTEVLVGIGPNQQQLQHFASLLRFPEVPQEVFLALEGLYRAFAGLVRSDRMTDKSQDMK